MSLEFCSEEIDGRHQVGKEEHRLVTALAFLNKESVIHRDPVNAIENVPGLGRIDGRI